LRFQVKVILATTLIMIAILFYLNTMVFTFAESLKEEWLSEFFNKDKISKRNLVEIKFKDYVKNVLLWEFLLVLSLMLVLYKIIERMTRQEREYRDFLELILLTISHKFGNFLATQRGNIEILKLRNDARALERLEKSYLYIQEDFHRILDTINKFRDLKHSKEKINLRETVERILTLTQVKVEIKTLLNDVYVNSNREMLENIVFPIIENALKYSKDIVQIRLSRKQLVVRNKIFSEQDKGSGIGLKIVETLAKKMGYRLIYRTKGEYFLVCLKLK